MSSLLCGIDGMLKREHPGTLISLKGTLSLSLNPALLPMAHGFSETSVNQSDKDRSSSSSDGNSLSWWLVHVVPAGEERMKIGTRGRYGLQGPSPCDLLSSVGLLSHRHFQKSATSWGPRVETHELSLGRAIHGHTTIPPIALPTFVPSHWPASTFTCSWTLLPVRLSSHPWMSPYHLPEIVGLSINNYLLNVFQIPF